MQSEKMKNCKPISFRWTIPTSACFLTHESWHRYTLKSLSHPVDDKEMFLYSYKYVMHGFSASPKFLGLNHKYGLSPTTSYGEGVTIGILDTGIWLESESFNDKGMPPVPQRWKGQYHGTHTSSTAAGRHVFGAEHPMLLERQLYSKVSILKGVLQLSDQQ
ncbi:conserved hypothetical protein [Ricinus communis]|uniref:Inhibitor I9 domain-containing protein n=1 Tax=Ricinus communis TaxID=3988 RepID=B9R7A0_RICCO|nr:conserved hypothetical protein [Ricinus communis]